MVNKCILWQKEKSISHVWKVITIVSMICICCPLFIGCGESELDDGDPIDDENLIADNFPNLDDPKVREQILAEALDEDNLQTRNSPSGEELYYAPNQEVPYTGWVKETSYNDDVPFALWQVQNGERHGVYLKWYDNQQNQEKGFYKTLLKMERGHIGVKTDRKVEKARSKTVLKVAYGPSGLRMAISTVG